MNLKIPWQASIPHKVFTSSELQSLRHWTFSIVFTTRPLEKFSPLISLSATSSPLCCQQSLIYLLVSSKVFSSSISRKSSPLDNREKSSPLNFQQSLLLCTVSKVFTSVLLAKSSPLYCWQSLFNSQLLEKSSSPLNYLQKVFTSRPQKSLHH